MAPSGQSSRTRIRPLLDKSGHRKSHKSDLAGQLNADASRAETNGNSRQNLGSVGLVFLETRGGGGQPDRTKCRGYKPRSNPVYAEDNPVGQNACIGYALCIQCRNGLGKTKAGAAGKHSLGGI